MVGKQRLSPFNGSACCQILQNCIFDDVQMRCILATMAVRREYYDGQILGGRSAAHIQAALMAVREHLQSSQVVNTRLIYSIMKLCHAEAYRNDFDSAFVHLTAARAVLEQLGSWRDLDLEYVATLCGSGHAYRVTAIWMQPRSFPCLVDPGHASSCFPFEIYQLFIFTNRPCNETGQQRFSVVTVYDAEAAALLQQIMLELVEYCTVQNNMLHFDQCGLLIPRIVAQWAPLRRYALLSKLLSIEITRNPFLHAVRVSLILWLTTIANFAGYDQDLQIVAVHLRDIMAQISADDEQENSEMVSWILIMGAMAGNARCVSPWFIHQLAKLLGDNHSSKGKTTGEWFICLETLCHQAVYCEPVQKSGLLGIAEDIFRIFRSSA